jgi:predicted transposase YbfD/YdcC
MYYSKELLHHARMEWSVESMHWLLDVHFEEDWCRIESKAVQQCLNMFRKVAINLIKRFKSSNNSKQAISNLMFECLLDYSMVLRILNEN